ncbi:MAG: Holliday junction resolvase RuvX [Patescibacteria group bacterium]|jgi:putative Holliday junction resolvase
MTFLQKIKPPLVAFDWGKKRIGVCVSPDGRMSFPREHIEISGEEEALVVVSRFIADEGIQTVVLGLPVSLSGEETRMAEWIRDIGARIEEKTHVQVVFEDERLSTQEAQKKRTSSQQKSVDSLAAQVVLENYLAKQ